MIVPEHSANPRAKSVEKYLEFSKNSVDYVDKSISQIEDKSSKNLVGVLALTTLASGITRVDPSSLDTSNNHLLLIPYALILALSLVVSYLHYYKITATYPYNVPDGSDILKMSKDENTTDVDNFFKIIEFYSDLLDQSRINLNLKSKILETQIRIILVCILITVIHLSTNIWRIYG